MIDYSKLDFLIRSLELRQTDVAKETGTTPQNINQICLGISKPSLDLAIKIESLLCNVWQRRAGQTVPPEVAGLVKAILYPPPPEFPGGKKRASKTKKEEALGDSGPETQTEGIAAYQTSNSQGKGFSLTVGENPGVYVVEGGETDGRCHEVSEADVDSPTRIGFQKRDSANGGDCETLRDDSRALAGSKIEENRSVYPEGNSPSSEDQHARSHDGTVLPSGKFDSSQHGPNAHIRAEIISASDSSGVQGPSQFGRTLSGVPGSRGRNQEGVRESAFAVTTGQVRHGRMANGFSRGVFWSLEDVNDITIAARIRAKLNDSVPGVRNLRRQFYADIRSQSPAWLNRSNNDNAINAMLRRALPTAKLRQRSRDEELTGRNSKIAAFTLRFAATIESKHHSKGAYQRRAWMDLRATLLGLWDTAEFRAKIHEIADAEISFQTFERIFRDDFGKVSPMERAAKVWAPDKLGPLCEYPGQIVQMDASELPVEIAAAWGRARKDGDVAEIVAAIIDVGSLKTWMRIEGTTSEVYLWNPLIQQFFESTNYAPELFIMDEGGRGVNTLRHQQAGQPLTLDAAIRLLVASGAKPHCHTPGLPRAKGTVEAGAMKAGKSRLKRLLAGRFCKALFDEAKNIPVSYRSFETEADWRTLSAELEPGLNSRVVPRVGDGTLTRSQIWDLPEYAAKREERALAKDWREKWQSIVSRGFAMEVRGNATLYWKGARAELRTPLGRPVKDGSIAILFPGGIRAGDDQIGDELLRGLIIEDTRGQPVYHAVEALKVKKSFLGFELDRPKITEHPIAIPETAHQRKVRAWHEAGKALPAALREATTDSPIEVDDF